MLVCALPVASVVGDYFDDYVVNINDWQRWRDPEVFLHNTLVDEVGGDGSGGGTFGLLVSQLLCVCGVLG